MIDCTVQENGYTGTVRFWVDQNEKKWTKSCWEITCSAHRIGYVGLQTQKWVMWEGGHFNNSNPFQGTFLLWYSSKLTKGKRKFTNHLSSLPKLITHPAKAKWSKHLVTINNYTLQLSITALQILTLTKWPNMYISLQKNITRCNWTMSQVKHTMDGIQNKSVP